MSQSKHHRPEEWEAHRAEIRRLYIDEDRTLQHVMGAMGDRGFTATPKMYKTKLRQWNIFKNNRAADVAAILRSQAHRTAVGKESITVRNGKRVDTQTYLRRKGLSADDLLQLATNWSSNRLPIHLTCVTPPPALSKPMMGVLRSSPGRLGIKETIGRWVLGECEKLGDGLGTGMVIDSGIDCDPAEKERPLLIYYESAASKVAAEYYDAVWLLQKSQTTQGWALAHVVFSRMHVLLEDCEHLLYPILNLLIIILTLPSNTTDLHRTLWDYLSERARLRYDSEHPVYRVLRQLTELFDQGDSEDEKYGLLYSVVSDAVASLGEKMEADGQKTPSSQAYYDLVTLWYAETLRSHRAHRHGYYPQLHLGPDDVLSTWDDSVAQDLGEGHALELACVHSHLLLDLGWQTSWHDPSVYETCVALLQAKEQTDASADEVEVNCLTAMALYRRQQNQHSPAFSANGDVMVTAEYEQQQQNSELARQLLSEAVFLDWELSGASIYNFEGLLLLQEWCSEDGDWANLEVVRHRSQECLRILFREWDV
ncbi:hypothetical protein SCAR479_05912 [Seiridium cardinale]|uniref:Clr5 domain-containing protein n=1 Tax=Seiridium cardinale TaxID=138064 RepID=A0ABR2XV25_9PEZI